MHKRDVQVEKRTVFSGRKRAVYDARGTHEGIEYNIRGASTRAEAIAQAIAEVEYLRNARSHSAHGFTLAAHGTCEWFLRFPHGGGMGFGSPDFSHAVARLRAEYAYHAEVSAFLATIAD